MLKDAGITEDLTDLFNQLLGLAETTGRKDDSDELENCRSKVASNLFLICDESFSEKEMDSVIALLQSPAGQKLVKVLAKLQESIVKSLDEFLEKKKKETIKEMVNEAARKENLRRKTEKRVRVVIPPNIRDN